MFCLITYKLDIHVGCLFKRLATCAFIAYKKQWRNYQSLTLFESENDDIFHIFDQIKVSRVPL